MQELDPRIVRVSIVVNGQIKTYEGLDIVVRGIKFANSNQNECEIEISNLDKPTSDYILSETSPFNANRSAKSFIIQAGRVSYGVSKIFSGNIINSIITQPPDTKLILKALTENDKKTKMVSNTQPGLVPLSNAAKQVASDLQLNLIFQAVDKNISNYNYTGPALKQVNRLEETGQVNAYVDDENLIIKDSNTPLKNKIKLLDLESGMIGIPEITEFGIKVTYLLDAQTTLGGLLRIKSKVYPAVNGDYMIYKLGFDIATRDTPFYWIAEAKKI